VSHHEKCCLSELATMSDATLLSRLSEIMTEAFKRWPDMQQVADKYSLTVDNIGSFGDAIKNAVIEESKSETKQ
jgi:hypothetical protein